MDLTVLLSCAFGVSNLSRPPTSRSLVTHQKCSLISMPIYLKASLSTCTHVQHSVNFLMTQSMIA